MIVSHKQKCHYFFQNVSSSKENCPLIEVFPSFSLLISFEKTCLNACKYFLSLFRAKARLEKKGRDLNFNLQVDLGSLYSLLS